MICWIRTLPIHDIPTRRQILWRIAGFFLIAVLVLLFVVTFVTLVFETLRGANVHLLAFFLPLMIWLYGLFLMVPALIIALPIANAALQFGYAGLLPSIAATSVLCSFGAVALVHPNTDYTVLIFGICGGILFGGIYWIGGYRAAPQIFGSKPPS